MKATSSEAWIDDDGFFLGLPNSSKKLKKSRSFFSDIEKQQETARKLSSLVDKSAKIKASIG
jgi:hypothetical protein